MSILLLQLKLSLQGNRVAAGLGFGRQEVIGGLGQLLILTGDLPVLRGLTFVRARSMWAISRSSALHPSVSKTRQTTLSARRRIGWIMMSPVS